MDLLLAVHLDHLAYLCWLAYNQFVVVAVFLSLAFTSAPLSRKVFRRIEACSRCNLLRYVFTNTPLPPAVHVHRCQELWLVTHITDLDDMTSL